MKNTLLIFLFAVIAVGFGYSQEKPEATKLSVAKYTFTFSEPWVNQPAGGMRSGVVRFTQKDEKLEDVDAKKKR